MDISATQIITNLTRLIDDRIRAALGEQTPPTVIQWMDTKRAAAYIGVPPSRMYDLVALGKVTPYRDGRTLRFTSDQLDEYLRRDQ